MKTTEEVLRELKMLATAKVKRSQEYFGVTDVNSLGLTTPQIRKIAKLSGTNHDLAIALWKTGIHEARHVASMIADPGRMTEKLMDQWVRDFNSWDIVDGTCSSLFRKTAIAYRKAMQWSKRKNEFEKRAGFAMMAQLAVHDKNAADSEFEQFLMVIKSESDDDRNFVKKAVNWALRQIGKRNERLCIKAIALSKDIAKKGDAASRWIAADALRELEKYQREGRIKNVGKA